TEQQILYCISLESQKMMRHCLNTMGMAFCDVATAKPYAILSGYHGEKGLKSLIINPSAVNSDDRAYAYCMHNRLKSYVNRFSAILFNKHHCFKDALSCQEKEALAWVYADFLKEFF